MLAFLAAGVAVAQAQTNTYSSCTNSYQSGTLAPTGYGSAYDKVFGGLDVSVDCNGNTVTVGNGKANQYVYKNAYVYTTNGWQVLNLTSPATLQSNNWYAAQATASLGGVDLTQTTYVVGYTCDWSNSVWKCGCADETCATPSWQLQLVKGEKATTTATTGNTTGNTTGIGNVRPVPLSETNRAAIQVSVGTMLDFSNSGTANAMVISSDNPDVVAKVDAIHAKALSAGTTELVVAYNLSCTASDGSCPGPNQDFRFTILVTN